MTKLTGRYAHTKTVFGFIAVKVEEVETTIDKEGDTYTETHWRYANEEDMFNLGMSKVYDSQKTK